jgi:hypothetical protein
VISSSRSDAPTPGAWVSTEERVMIMVVLT